MKYRFAKPELKWKFTKGAPKMPSPILVGNELYYVTDNGIANCLDARTGEAIWRERVGGEYRVPIADGSSTSQANMDSSPKPGRTFKKLAENKLDGYYMASFAPVIVIVIRSDKALYRVDGS